MRMCFSAVLSVGAAALLAAASATAQPTSTDRFRGMDTNGDGVITRDEWRGSDRSFAVHDWNNDGVLSGDEIRSGAQRGRWDTTPRAGSDSDLRDWTPERFAALDRDGDGRVTRREWPFDIETFQRIDRDNNDWISRAEFTGSVVDDDRDDRFDDLDTNHDGRVTIQEWHGSTSAYTALDRNRDGVLSRSEVGYTDAGPSDLFDSLDENRDGRVSASEWRWSRAAFDRRDTNNDGSLSREELGTRAVGTSGTQSAAWRAGAERGLLDGRKAGREDKQLRNRWDLEGQRELEQADAGYQESVGARSEYQAGYRDAFRRGYAEGFGPRP
jgi:Ca2+-binding EF-hand superfamily protein